MWENIKQWSGRILTTGGVVSILGFLWNVVFPIPGQIDDGLAWAAIVIQMWVHVTDPITLLFAGTAIACLGLGTAKWWLDPVSRRLSKKQDPPALPEPAEPTREYATRTPKEITHEAFLHEFDDEPWSSPEIGKWLRFEGSILAAPDTRRDPIEITMESRGDGEWVFLHFDNATWREQLTALKTGECIKGTGKIVGVEANNMTLHDCKLLDTVKSAGRGRREDSHDLP
ncbi:MAG: hypothetical protein OXE05_04020 [Chloroflexi bacterium]|nr:hypothetical protein [Chloroflexota bacterium]